MKKFTVVNVVSKDIESIVAVSQIEEYPVIISNDGRVCSQLICDIKDAFKHNDVVILLSNYNMKEALVQSKLIDTKYKSIWFSSEECEVKYEKDYDLILVDVFITGILNFCKKLNSPKRLEFKTGFSFKDNRGRDVYINSGEIIKVTRMNGTIVRGCLCSLSVPFEELPIELDFEDNGSMAYIPLNDVYDVERITYEEMRDLLKNPSPL